MATTSRGWRKVADNENDKAQAVNDALDDASAGVTSIANVSAAASSTAAAASAKAGAAASQAGAAAAQAAAAQAAAAQAAEAVTAARPRRVSWFRLTASSGRIWGSRSTTRF